MFPLYTVANIQIASFKIQIMIGLLLTSIILIGICVFKNTFIFPNKHGNLHLVSTGGMSVICSIYGIMKNDQADMIFLEQGKLNDDIIYLLIGLWGLSLLMIFFIKLIIDRIFDNRKKKLTDMNDTSLWLILQIWIVMKTIRQWLVSTLWVPKICCSYYICPNWITNI